MLTKMFKRGVKFGSGLVSGGVAFVGNRRKSRLRSNDPKALQSYMKGWDEVGTEPLCRNLEHVIF